MMSCSEIKSDGKEEHGTLIELQLVSSQVTLLVIEPCFHGDHQTPASHQELVDYSLCCFASVCNFCYKIVFISVYRFLTVILPILFLIQLE